MKAYEDEGNTVVVAHKKANVSVPITIKPKVTSKDVLSFCCGEPVLRKSSCNCDACRKSQCKFILSQNICIEIPVEFSADVMVSEAYIDCNMPE